MASLAPKPRSRAPLPLEAEGFLVWLAVERGRSVNTLAAYRRDLTEYVVWLADVGRSLGTVDARDLERFVVWLQASGKAPASVARTTVAVRSLYRFLAQEDPARGDPAAELEAPRVRAGLPKPLTEDEVVALLAVVAGDDSIARRDRALLEVLYATGARISEVCGLSLGDVDLDHMLVRLLGKGAKERIVPMGRHAVAALVAWLAAGGRDGLVPERWARRGDLDAVFLNHRGGRLSRQAAWSIVCHHGDRAGLSGRLSPHVLRHSCATHLVDHGADIRVVQELLGHASISTTQIYTKVSTERLRSVYDASHPRAKGRPGSVV